MWHRRNLNYENCDCRKKIGSLVDEFSENVDGK